MDVENYPDLADLLLGRGTAERSRAPEPTLLPHLAPFAGRDDLEELCRSAQLYAEGNSGPPPWPDLRQAVFRSVAMRLGEDSESGRLLEQFPALGSCLSERHLALVDLALGSGDGGLSHAELLARLAARFPLHANGALLSGAREAAGSFGDWERPSLLGWLGGAVPAAERSEILAVLLSTGHLQLDSAAALLPYLNGPEQLSLVMHIADIGYESGERLASRLAFLLPLVDQEQAAAVTDKTRACLSEPERWLPGWYVSLVVARLNRAGHPGLAADYVASCTELDAGWQAHLQALAARDLGERPFRDVLFAHPGAEILLSQNVVLGSLAPQVRSILDDMIDHWGGSGPPLMAGPPPSAEPEPEPVPVPVPEPEPEPVPRRAARGGRLRRRISRMGRGIGRAVPEPERSGSEPEETRAGPPAETRFLQADIFVRQDGTLTKRSQSFEKGALHEIQASIAPPSAEHVQLNEAFPDHLLPPDQAGHELTVLLVAPGLFDDARSETIKLPRSGASETATFVVTVPADLERVDLTFIVLHQGTHIQTGYLSGPATAGEGDARATGFSFKTGQRSAADLDHGEKPDLTFYKDGRQLVIHRPGHDDRAPSMAGIDSRFDKIRQALFDGASGAYQLDSGLGTGPGLKLLRMLAAQGEFMRRQLFGDDSLSEVRRVQVVSPYSADFFPVEYFYDRRPPKKEAALCPAFAAGSGTGDSCDGCTSADDGSIVCPLGFWGLNRVIERQVRPIDLEGDPPPEPSTRDDLLPAVGGVVFAASNHVNDDNPNEVAETLAALNDITGSRSWLAPDWKQWQQPAGLNKPVLLVALPHNVDNELGFQALQIGADAELALNEIGEDYEPPRESVILMLGCNTAAAAVEYEDFIARLRSAGAAVVVGTVTYVLGMQAAPLAREFVRQFWLRGGGDQVVPMGEVVRAVRTRMVRAGNPMALAICAFGGADWRLAPRED